MPGRVGRAVPSAPGNQADNGALDTYIRKCVIFAQILKIRVRVDLRHESGRGLRALQDLAEIAAGRFFAKRLGVRAVLCRFVALANADNSTLGFRATPGLGTARRTAFEIAFGRANS